MPQDKVKYYFKDFECAKIGITNYKNDLSKIDVSKVLPMLRDCNFLPESNAGFEKVLMAM